MISYKWLVLYVNATRTSLAKQQILEASESFLKPHLLNSLEMRGSALLEKFYNVFELFLRLHLRIVVVRPPPTHPIAYTTGLNQKFEKVSSTENTIIHISSSVFDCEKVQGNFFKKFHSICHSMLAELN